jgi:hypothetical protein
MIPNPTGALTRLHQPAVTYRRVYGDPMEAWRDADSGSGASPPKSQVCYSTSGITPFCHGRPIMSQEDWRSPAAYEYANSLESPGLAWEFLRRNPDYRADHRAAARDAGSGDARARVWGLRFPGGP